MDNFLEEMKIKIDNLKKKDIFWRNYMKFEHIPITKIDLDKDKIQE